MELLASALLMLLAGANWLKHRDILYPAFIHALLWAVVLLLVAANRETFGGLSTITVAITTLGALAFSLTCYLSTAGFTPERLRVRLTASVLPSSTMVLFLLLATLALLPLYVERALELGSSGPSELFLVNLRGALTGAWGERDTFGPLKYAIPLAYTTAAAVMLKLLSPEAGVRHWLLFLLALGAAATYAFLATGRSFILMLAVCLAGPLLVTRRVAPATAALAGLAFIVATFIYVGVLLRKVSHAGDFFSLLQASLDSLLAYYIGGIYAFDGLVSETATRDLGANSFRFLWKLLQSAGLPVEVKDLVQNFVSHPIRTNVYTIYQPYLKDFGVAGCVLAQAAYGYMHGAVYRRAFSGSDRLLWGFVYGILLYPLVMQFFQDQYITLLSTWIQYSLISFVLFRLSAVSPSLITARTVSAHAAQPVG